MGLLPGWDRCAAVSIGHQPRNFTEIQLRALGAPVNLCDGYARQSIGEATRRELGEVLARVLGSPVDVRAVQRRFLRSMSVHTGQGYDEFPTYLCYSASVAIDLVGKYLSWMRYRVGVIHPSIDSIPALLRRGGCDLVAVPQARLFPCGDFDYLDGLELGALFVVTPNNPTGAAWEEYEVLRVFEWAAARNVVVILDLSLRLLDGRARGDLLSMAESAGTTVMTIDDTGKAVSLLGTKVGVLATTVDLEREMGLLHSEVLLSVSALDLCLLGAILEQSGSGSDEVAAARDLARDNRIYLRNVFANRFPSGAAPPAASIGVDWLHVGERQPEVVGRCRERGLAIMPGNSFYWAPGDGGGREWIRLALVRDRDLFRRGAGILATVLAQVATS